MPRYTKNISITIDPKKDKESMNEFMKMLSREKRGEQPVKKNTLTKRDDKEKAYLNQVARDVWDKIQTMKYGTPILLSSKFRPYRTNTNGWSIELGLLKGYRTKIEIWFDYYSNHSERKIWYGFTSENKKYIEKIASFGEKRIGKPRKLLDEDLITDKKTKAYKVAIPFKISEFGKPFIELYDESVDYYYGMYEHQKNLNKNKTVQFLITRIAEFIETVARDLPESKPKPDRDDFQTEENRRVIRKHLYRERSGYLPTLRKQLDNYTCQVCGMKYENVYGSIGKNYAEAHHKMQLSKLNGKVSTSVDDLVTVCSNCHRMLHRLNGKSSDISYLKKHVKLNNQRKLSKKR